MTVAADSSRTILQQSRDQRELERVATGLASSQAPADVALLTEFLTQASFLDRLDSLRDPPIKTLRFGRVVMVVGRNPSNEASTLLSKLVDSKDVAADLDRIDQVLTAAAVLVPQPIERAELFARVDARRYALLAINLLIGNGSPNALAEAKRQIIEKPKEVEDPAVVSILHKAIVPRRTALPIVQLADDLLSAKISMPLKIGVVESMFDYRYDEWYGPIKNPPTPPVWESASNEALAALIELAEKARKLELPNELRERLTVEERRIRNIIDDRK